MDEFIGKVKEQATWAKKEAEKLGKKMYDKTNTAISVGKLSFAISETDSKIKDKYEEIGKLVYEKYLETGTSSEYTETICEAIDSLFAEKMSLKAKKAELKSSVSCPNCGNYNKKDAVYCSKCGTKLEDDDENAADDYSTNVDDSCDNSAEDYTSYFETTPKSSDNVKEKFADAAEKAKTAVSDAIPDSVKDKAEDAADTAQKVYDTIKDKVEESAPEIKEKADSVKDRIEEKVRKVIKIKPKKPEDE